MNATLDQILVATTLLGAFAFFALRFLRKKKSCSSGCGCDVAKSPIKR